MLAVNAWRNKEATYLLTYFRTAFVDLNLYLIKGALALFVLVSGYVC